MTAELANQLIAATAQAYEMNGSVSELTRTLDGVLSLRNTMEVLRELSIEYNRLEESDVRKTNLHSSVGDEADAILLDALLRQWDAHETMLPQYEKGTGSMADVAEKAANSWEGSMNRLSNTWTDIVQNITDSDGIKAGVNALNSLLSVLNNVTDWLGSLGTIGLGTGLLPGIKNVGSPKMFGVIFV